MKIVVIGAGSIGLLSAFYLAKKGCEPILMTNRNEQASIIREQGIHMNDLDGKTEVTTMFAKPISTLMELGPIDIAIIAVKSYQVKGVLIKLQHVKVNAVLFLQNGMGHVELFNNMRIPEIGVAVIEHGALRINDHTVVHTGIGQLKWSYVKKRTDFVEKLFTNWEDPNFPVHHEDNWLEMLQHKLIINACINPLTALLQVENGELLTNEYHFNMVRAVFNEVISVIHVKSEEKMWEQVCNVCQSTQKNRSSMLVDIDNNRQTEIDSILGYLIKKAEKKHILTPVLKFLYNGIKSRGKRLNKEV